MKTKSPEVPRVAADPEYAAAAEKLAELQTESAGTQAKIAAADRARSERTSRATSPVDALAREYLGDAAEGDGEAWISDEELADLRLRARGLERAVTVQRQRVDQIRGEVSRRTCEELRPHARALFEDLARKLVELSEAADAVYDFQAAMDAAGIRWEGHLTASVPLGWMRTGIEDSRVNHYVDEIEKDYALVVKRPKREAARLLAYQEHMELEERKRLEKEQAERDRQAAIRRSWGRGKREAEAAFTAEGV